MVEGASTAVCNVRFTSSSDFAFSRAERGNVCDWSDRRCWSPPAVPTRYDPVMVVSKAGQFTRANESVVVAVIAPAVVRTVLLQSGAVRLNSILKLTASPACRISTLIRDHFSHAVMRHVWIGF